jgi:hypothetical protein
MAKIVKFNMRFGKTSIRTVDDLRENFVMEDVLAHFENGQLLKFLKRRDYTDYAEKVLELTNKKPSPDETVRELITIFEMDEEALSEFIEIEQLRRKKQRMYEVYTQGKEKEKNIIKNYFDSYNQVVETLIDNKNNLAKIKANVKELIDRYMPVLELDWRELFYRLGGVGALYPMCYLLKHDFFKEHWLNTKNDEKTDEDEDRKKVKLDLIDVFSQAMKEAKGVTNNASWLQMSNKSSEYWEDIEAKGKTYMVIGMPKNSKARSFGDMKNELSGSDLNGKFEVLDGIQYRHSSASVDYLFYVEV